MRKIIIADRTVVLKSQSKDTSLSFKEKVEIARLLESAKVQVVEFPAIENVKIDTLLLKTICAFLKNSTMSVCTGMTEEGVTNAWNAISSASNPRLSVALPLSPVQMEYVCHKKAPKMLELITSLVEKSASLCKDVEFVALDATRAEKDFLYDAINTAITTYNRLLSVSKKNRPPSNYANHRLSEIFTTHIRSNCTNLRKQFFFLCTHYLFIFFFHVVISC